MRNAKPKRPPEREIIRAICRGETHLFYALIEPHQRAVYAIAYSVVNNAADAEDVAQEAFLKALKGLHKFRGESKFGTWLIQIALNEARSRLKRGRAHLHDSIDADSPRRRASFARSTSPTGATFPSRLWRAKSCGRKFRPSSTA